MDPKMKPTTSEQIEQRKYEREHERALAQLQERQREHERRHDADQAERNMIVKIVTIVAVGIVAFTAILSVNVTRSNRTSQELSTQRVVTCLEHWNTPLECSLVSQLRPSNR